MKDSPLLEVRGLTKTFPGVKALDSVSFKLEKGSVHAVCGENGAGKSTLMNILMGVYQPSKGEIYVHNEAVQFQAPRQALNSGFAIIEQELNPVLGMTVAENIFLGREETRFGFWMNYAALVKKSRHLLDELEVDINPMAKMSGLSLAQIQLVEIAKALSYDSDVIIMDEPTSAIGEQDADRLFKIIKVLQQKGKGIIYVSHRLKEIFAVADTVTVLRDGKYIGTYQSADINRGDLIRMMIGRKLEEEYVKTNTPNKEIVMEVWNLSKEGIFQDISLSVHQGEILGIFGLMGSGRSELFDALFGVEPADSGKIIVLGQEKRQRNPAEAKKNGLAFVTEDRKLSGLILQSSIRDNLTLASLSRLSRGIFINGKREAEEVRSMIEQFQVKTTGPRQIVSRLSGGNQQKVVLSKWLLTKPKILLLDEPTRGIDVGTKRNIYAFMSQYAQQGNAVIMISSELPEVMSMSDRIIVMHNGRKVGDCNRDEFSQDDLMRLASEGAAR